jgi:hypothetical protein
LRDIFQSSVILYQLGWEVLFRNVLSIMGGELISGGTENTEPGLGFEVQLTVGVDESLTTAFERLVL